MTNAQSKHINSLPQYEDFIDSLVAYIDILGFDHRVKNIRNSVDFFEIGKLLFACKVNADAFNQDEGIFKNFKITAISDSIIITVPFTDPICTVGMLTLLHKFQYELLATEFQTIIRGYINRGPVYHANGLLFGAGYSNAYHGEQSIGAYPRIVCSPHIVRDARKAIDAHPNADKMTTAFDFLREDKDGYYYVDYLKPIGGQLVLSKDQLSTERNGIEKLIASNIEEHNMNDKVRAKYKWLETYFHQTSSYYS